jgi:diguanylate cyclase (GGDEF)-like protein/PAS domain S-box-containing protein
MQGASLLPLLPQLRASKMPDKRTQTKDAPRSPSRSPLESLINANERLQADVGGYLSREEQWQGERAWLLAMIDQVPDYLFVKDTQCRFVVANKAIATDLGHADPRSLLGKTDLEIHPPEVADQFYQGDQEVMRTGQALLDMEEFVVRPSGEIRWLSTSKLPLRGPNGKIIGIIGIARDITERKRAEDRIHFLAYHDTLTNLPNRSQFESELKTTIKMLTAETEAALLYIDLDRFKSVNDTLGHVAGDELIRQVAGRLSRLARESDIVARLGGDEFAVLLTCNAGHAAIEALSERILAEISRPYDLFGDAAFIGASIGISRLRGGIEVEHILREADIALYEAKAGGRGRWQVFAAEMASALEQRRVIEHDLRDALAAGDQLVLAYQPIFAADAKSIVGAEALVRWKHPTRGLMSPDLFIATAEERGLIDTLGEWVLEEACRLLQITNLPWVAVNVSPVQLRNQSFADRVLAILAVKGMDPARLQLEITEGVLLENVEATGTALQRLRQAGIRLALDDFGTGYSSLNYLRRYNVDKLKVDRSFVAQLGISEDADVIIRTIVSLARAMKMKVTAEGVETQQQRDHLASIGCHELQGYLLSRPVSLDAFQQLLLTAHAG